MALVRASIFFQVSPDGPASRYQQPQNTPEFASCDETLSPWAIACRHGRFDFTFLFEHFFLAAVAPAIFLLLQQFAVCNFLVGRRSEGQYSSILQIGESLVTIGMCSG